ncbi:TPA: hypothetical protein EYP26_04480 [Candidatus Bathyarchaeota archaeon]|nr:hypothetical protein [Candidatus Bathyarchaeota archaeon]
MIEQLIREKIKNFFLAKGLTLIEEEESCVTFKEGHLTLFIEILSGERILDKNAILNAALRAMSKFENSNKVYLALPKVYASIINGEIFHFHGIGVLTYDEREVEEIVPAKLVRRRFTTEQGVQNEGVEKLRDELRKLRENYIALKETVKLLKIEVAKLKESLARIPLKEGSAEVKVSPQKVEISTSLPSFFKDNPWLEVLARRGREPENYGP